MAMGFLIRSEKKVEVEVAVAVVVAVEVDRGLASIKYDEGASRPPCVGGTTRRHASASP